MYADITNIKFLAKSTVDPIYCLVFVDFYTSKSYTYPMKNKRNLLAKKIEQFYNDIEKKKKRDLNNVMKLQTGLEFQQNDIKKLNKIYNVERFSIGLKGGNAFAAE